MSKANDNRDESKNPESLEREVNEARARLGRTANELSERLSPGELLDQALGMAREHGGDLGRNLGSQVKNNPIPMMLTSVGISWMMMSSGSGGGAHAGDSHDTSTANGGSGLKDSLGSAARKPRDKAHEIGDRIHGTSASVKNSAQNARASLVEFYREQPLLAGSLGIAIGAALGGLVPPTEMEDDMFGQARDHSVDAAKSKAAKEYDEIRGSVRDSF